MIAAHIILGIACGTLIATYVWLAFGVSIWTAILVYWIAGSAACLVSAGVAILIAAVCPGRPEYSRKDDRAGATRPHDVFSRHHG